MKKSGIISIFCLLTIGFTLQASQLEDENKKYIIEQVTVSDNSDDFASNEIFSMLSHDCIVLQGC